MKWKAQEYNKCFHIYNAISEMVLHKLPSFTTNKAKAADVENGLSTADSFVCLCVCVCSGITKRNLW